jgi:hypothetical protein
LVDKSPQLYLCYLGLIAVGRGIKGIAAVHINRIR